MFIVSGNAASEKTSKKFWKRGQYGYNKDKHVCVPDVSLEPQNYTGTEQLSQSWVYKDHMCSSC